MSKEIILITGGTGLVGSAIKEISSEHSKYDFIFLSSKDVDLKLEKETIEYFESLPPEQKLCFSFNRLTQNIKDSVELVYRQLNLSVTPEQAEYLENLDTRQNLRDAGYKTGSEEFQEFEFFDRFAAEVDKNHEALLKSIHLIK